MPRNGGTTCAPAAHAIGGRLLLLQVEPDELEPRLECARDDEARALDHRRDAAGVVVGPGRVGRGVVVRAHEEAGAAGVTAGARRDHVVVCAAAERERGERDREAQRAQLGGDVIAGGAVALGCGVRMAHPFERGDVATQPAREDRALIRG
jgi:hypothetical protein